MNNSRVFTREVLRPGCYDDNDSNQDHHRTIPPVIVEIVWINPGTKHPVDNPNLGPMQNRNQKNTPFCVIEYPGGKDRPWNKEQQGGY